MTIFLTAKTKYGMIKSEIMPKGVDESEKSITGN